MHDEHLDCFLDGNRPTTKCIRRFYNAVFKYRFAFSHVRRWLESIKNGKPLAIRGWNKNLISVVKWAGRILGAFQRVSGKYGTSYTIFEFSWNRSRALFFNGIPLYLFFAKLTYRCIKSKGFRKILGPGWYQRNPKKRNNQCHFKNGHGHCLTQLCTTFAISLRAIKVPSVLFSARPL